MSVQSMPYGAFELKATYQRNLLIGQLITVSIVIAAMLIGHLVWAGHQPAVANKSPQDSGGPRMWDQKPPTIIKSGTDIKPRAAKPEANSQGTLEPVSDDAVPEDVVILSTPGRAAMNESGNSRGNSNTDSDHATEGSDEFRPDIDTLIFVEELPELIYSTPPDYPVWARNSGQEGRVVIKALVGKKGDVLDAVVLVSSGYALLDEAALAVAGKYKYRPAIQNGRPVAIWVTYKVDFKLEH